MLRIPAVLLLIASAHGTAAADPPDLELLAPDERGAERRPAPETEAAAPKRLENVSREEAYALFHSLENVRKNVLHRRVAGRQALNAEIRYVSGPTQQSERGWYLPVRVATRFWLLGNLFETEKVFLFEWNEQTRVLTAEIDQPRVTKGRFNMRVSSTSGGVLGKLRPFEALAGGGVPTGEAALNASTRTVFLQNLPMSILPHVYLTREGSEGFVRAWAGLRFESRVETAGVVVPGVQRGVSLDVGAQQDRVGVGATRRQRGFQDRADVQVEGVIWASFTYQQKFVRREVGATERMLSFVRTTPSPLNLEVRPRFHYQVRSGATVLQGTSFGNTQRYARPRAAPRYTAGAPDWHRPEAAWRRTGRAAPRPRASRGAR